MKTDESSGCPEQWETAAPRTPRQTRQAWSTYYKVPCILSIAHASDGNAWTSDSPTRISGWTSWFQLVLSTMVILRQPAPQAAADKIRKGLRWRQRRRSLSKLACFLLTAALSLDAL